MIKNVIVRKPSKNFADGITTSNLGKPDYKKALKQHEQYIKALEKCGCSVTILDADEKYPDSTFVEDVAIVTEKSAIITKPGAESRKGEEKEIIDVLKKFYNNIEFLSGDACLDGGDILRAENHFYIGQSKRTNAEGAKQLTEILNKYGYTASTVPVKKILHLKTGIVYLGKNTFIGTGEFIDNDSFKDFKIINVDADEAYSANCIMMNGNLIIPKGFEKSKKNLVDAGYKIVEVEMSEFQKMDGGLTCLSLRIPVSAANNLK
ncbi:dimethylarginine dimethylaminohydrolase family protein [Clostridium ljungdahlii]|uniref:N(G),N(G)-dimethylarginine dimethylaminohydrolase n=1 Tax=Clostridium ljungdahlii TaxID=1538 RepID=A0A162KLP1_9CLOT|nr:arginine deiminase-related protein [Clostridium ljungdahlii]OAA83952.1 N(G),N(G)-dimethylarginine dimethylaminohydrolase [Clostridium ljungdahlii]